MTDFDDLNGLHGVFKVVEFKYEVKLHLFRKTFTRNGFDEAFNFIFRLQTLSNQPKLSKWCMWMGATQILVVKVELLEDLR